MNKENRKTESDNKILSFHIAEEEMQDPQLDHYVRESLIREADELEEELNARPDLADVKAPAGMYQAIVGELKERGVWEEDADDAEAVQEDSARETAAAGGNCTEETVAAQGAGFAEEMQAAEPAETAQRDEAELEALYAQLPEEDRKALALGREVARKQEEKEKAKTGKRRRRKKVFRIAGVAAACLALLFGISMTSDANRRLVQRMWDGFMVEFGLKIDTNYVGEQDTVRGKSIEEIKAMEAIGEQLGNPAIEFMYLPEEMEYEGYEIESEFVATLFYSYLDTLFYATIMNVDEEGSYYYKYDNEAVLRKTVETFDGIEAKIWEVNLDIDTETYIAEIDYDGWRYVLNGMIPLEEMEQTIQSVFFL